MQVYVCRQCSIAHPCIVIDPADPEIKVKDMVCPFHASVLTAHFTPRTIPGSVLNKIIADAICERLEGEK